MQGMHQTRNSHRHTERFTAFVGKPDSGAGGASRGRQYEPRMRDRCDDASRSDSATPPLEGIAGGETHARLSKPASQGGVAARSSFCHRCSTGGHPATSRWMGLRMIRKERDRPRFEIMPVAPRSGRLSWCDQNRTLRGADALSLSRPTSCIFGAMKNFNYLAASLLT